MRTERSCQQCGNTFAVKPYVVTLGKGKFCGRTCVNKSKIGRPSPKAIFGTRSCVICGENYRNSHARERCCSAVCGQEFRRRNAIAKVEARIGEPLRPAIERMLANNMSMRAIAMELEVGSDRFLSVIFARLNIPRPSRSESVRLQWVRTPERRKTQAQRLGDYVRADPARARRQAIAANLKLQQTSPTSIERALMRVLDAAGITYQFQYVVGGKFLCDFAFPEAMLIVEADGSYWHRTERQKRRDASKDAYLKACGYTVLRLTETDIKQCPGSCLNRIRDLLHG